MYYFIYSFQVSFKAIWSVKMNMKNLKNILIVNNNFVFTIGLPYCYLPFKVIFRTNYFHEILWPTSHVLLIYMNKNKGHNYYYSTSERQSSYNQNNFIILMKFNTNRNNVSIEDNFQVSSFTAFRLNNLVLPHSGWIIYVHEHVWHYRKNSIYLSFSSSWNNQGRSFIQLVLNLIVLLLIPPHWHHKFLLPISLNQSTQSYICIW